MQLQQHIRRSRPRGFSLLELLAVVTIMGILAAVALPRISLHGQLAKKNVCSQYRSDINAALERYNFDHNVWAADLSELESEEYYPPPIPVCPVDNSAYTVNPITHRVQGHNH